MSSSVFLAHPPYILPKVELDESVFRSYGFKRSMDLKWKLEELIESFLITDSEVRDLVEEMLHEIQKKN